MNPEELDPDENIPEDPKNFKRPNPGDEENEKLGPMQKGPMESQDFSSSEMGSASLGSGNLNQENLYPGSGGKADKQKLQKGSILIASPEIDTGLFARAVMLICEYSDAGTFALIINKPLAMDLIGDFLAFGNIENPRIQLRAGGPIQSNQLMLLHGEKDLEEDVLIIIPGVFLGGDVDFLQEAMKEMEGTPILLCLGYCGWLGGQLEQECAEGLWIVSKITPSYIFDTPPEKLWQQALKDLGGRYKTLSLMPEDLSLN